MSPNERAEARLRGILEAEGLPVRGSYLPPEVCKILRIGIATFWRLIARYELDERGTLKHPDCLDSYMLRRNRRIAYPELVSYLQRNQSYQRDNAIHPDQLALFVEGD